MTKSSTQNNSNNVNINQVTQFTKRWEIEQQEWNTLPTKNINVRNMDSGETKVLKRPVGPEYPQ